MYVDDVNQHKLTIRNHPRTKHGITSPIVEYLANLEQRIKVNLAKIKSYGITEDRLLELNNFLENNGYKDTRRNTYVDIK